MEEIHKMLTSMDPEEALREIAKALNTLFSVLSEEVRVQFLLNLFGNPKDDKVSSMVHL